jgi:hypothetical protein
MKDAEVFYPNDDDPRKEKPDPLMEIDTFLKAKTRLGDEIPNVRALAENMGIGTGDLTALATANPDFQKGLGRVRKFLDDMLEDNDPWNNRIDVSLVRLLLSAFAKTQSEDEKKEDKSELTVFDQMNSYLKKEAPQDIEHPTVQGIAKRMGITDETLNHWLTTDGQFKEELERLKEFQQNDPYREGNEFDYFIHSSGIQFVLDETQKRYEKK